MDVVKRLAPSLVGWFGIALIVAGIWGRFGWECAFIALGLPIAGFYLWGEVRRASMKGIE